MLYMLSCCLSFSAWIISRPSQDRWACCGLVNSSSESAVHQIIKTSHTHHDAGREWLRPTCALGTWPAGSVDASWLLICSFVQCLLGNFLWKHHQPRIAWNSFCFFQRSLEAFSSCGPTLFSPSGWHKKLLSSWTMDGTAGSFPSLRPMCLRQTPSFWDFLSQRGLRVEIIVLGLSFSILKSKEVNAWTNASGKSVEPNPPVHAATPSIIWSWPTWLSLVSFDHWRDETVWARESQTQRHKDTDMHPYMQTCIHSYMHTYMHTYTYTYIHTRIHIYSEHVTQNPWKAPHSTLHSLYWYGNTGNMYKTVETICFAKTLYVTAFGFVGSSCFTTGFFQSHV